MGTKLEIPLKGSHCQCPNHPPGSPGKLITNCLKVVLFLILSFLSVGDEVEFSFNFSQIFRLIFLRLVKILLMNIISSVPVKSVQMAASVKLSNS